MDSFLTLASSSFAEIKILGSRFLGYAEPVRTEDDFTALLLRLRKEHHSATHHCSAWRLGVDGTVFHYSDDGEPTGTAGKRILGSIDKFGVTDVGVVVVRYYGGVKLGTGGLARAYAASADEALQQAEIVERLLFDEWMVDFDYDSVQQVHHALDLHGAEVLNREYGQAVRYHIRIRQGKSQDCERSIGELTHQRAVVHR